MDGTYPCVVVRILESMKKYVLDHFFSFLRVQYSNKVPTVTLARLPSSTVVRRSGRSQCFDDHFESKKLALSTSGF